MKALLLTIVMALATAQTTPGGKITGIVIQSGTDQPVENVQITLVKIRTSDSPASTVLVPPNASALTNRLGRFEIGNLEPGRYRMEWQRPGFYTPAVGSDGPSDAVIESLKRQLESDDLFVAMPPAATSVTVELAPQEQWNNFVFTLVPGGVISGRLLDSEGQPLANATLTPLRLAYEMGRRVLRSGGSAITSDDRGNFRLFGLRAGQYYVRAEYHRRTEATDELRRAYYPGVAAVDAAVSIAVTEGGEAPNVDFTIPATGTATISGNVAVPNVASTALPDLARTQFFIAPADAAAIRDGEYAIANSIASAPDRAAGKFELRGVPPGDYDLYGFTSDTPFTVNYTGRVRLNVGMAGLANVPITLRASGSVTGRIVSLDVPAVRRTFRLVPLDPVVASAPILMPTQLVNAQPDGTFAIPRLADGQYAVSLTVPDACVADIRQGNKSVNDAGFASGNNSGDVEVVLSKCGAIQVNVSDSSQRSVPNAVVSLVPAAELRSNPLLFKRATFDVASSRYLPMSTIPPGDYKLFAWDNIPPNAELNEDFLKPFEERGVSVTIQAGSYLSISLPLIP